MIGGCAYGAPLMQENAPTAGFKEIGGLFISSFERPSFLGETTQEATEKTTGRTTAKAGQLLEQLLVQPRTTTVELAALLGMTVDGVNYHLRNLQKTGRLVRVGGRRGGRWEVVLNAKGEGAGHGF